MWNYPPRRILVPVDFGAASARAARVAAALAERFGAAVVAVHAESIDVPPYFTADQIVRLERERSAARAAAERYVAEFARQAAGVLMSVRIREEPAADAILHESRDADLIVMGTHGRRGPRRWWLGSVAEQVVLHSTTPVLVVREAADDAPAGLMFSRVLYAAVAPAGAGSAAAHYAADLAAAFGGTLVGLESSDVAQEARAAGGTLLVVPRAAPPDESWVGDIAERLLRGCGMPMLFVPVT